LLYYLVGQNITEYIKETYTYTYTVYSSKIAAKHRLLSYLICVYDYKPVMGTNYMLSSCKFLINYRMNIEK